jgi:hypothetical protein
MMSDDVYPFVSHLHPICIPICPHLTAYKLHILRQLTKKVILSSRQTSDMPQGSARILEAFLACAMAAMATSHGRSLHVPYPKIHSAFEKRRILVCNAFAQ